MQHFFDVNIAATYGVDVAIFLKNIAYWLITNQANDINFRDGRYWTYNTIESFTKFFPYWSSKQIRRIIDTSVKEGLLIKDNYNKTAYDRTSWYTLSDNGLKLFNISIETLYQPICPNGQMKNRKRANEKPQTGTPIPNNKLNNKTERVEATEPEPPKKPKSTLSGFQPSPKHKALAEQYGLDLNAELRKFVAQLKANGSAPTDIDAAFSLWLERGHEYLKRKKGSQPTHVSIISPYGKYANNDPRHSDYEKNKKEQEKWDNTHAERRRAYQDYLKSKGITKIGDKIDRLM